MGFIFVVHVKGKVKGKASLVLVLQRSRLKERLKESYLST